MPRHEFMSTEEYVAPSGIIEEAVHAAWQSVLGHDEQRISAIANFFEANAVCCRCSLPLCTQPPPSHYLLSVCSSGHEH